MNLKFQSVADTPTEGVAHGSLRDSLRQCPTSAGLGRKDLFHERVPDEFIAEAFDVMAAAPQHIFQILTKRPGRMASVVRRLAPQPLPHIWFGTSVESTRFVWRIEKLKEVPAQVRFLSIEPLLGPLPDLGLREIDWVIVGGESGPGTVRSMPTGYVTCAIAA